MCLYRIVTLSFALICSSVISGSGTADDAQAWQPYRAVSPAQTLQEVVVPEDGITEAELDLMVEEACADPFDACGNPLPMVFDSRLVDPVLTPVAGAQQWRWHVLPDDLIWHSYWAGAKEPRISGIAFEEHNTDISLLDVSLGGRASVFRYGTKDHPHGRPEGWEVQIEGAGELRLNLDENWDFEAADFRFGVPVVYGRGKSQWKFSYYHLSSHLGDERIIRNMGDTSERINYSRDTLVLAYSFFPLPAWRWYAEAGWAFYADEMSDPWEFQFGLDYAQPGPTGRRGTPFLAINAHLREEVNFGGNFVTQAGWLWRGETGRVMRTGLHYYNGKSNQFEFPDAFEQQVGVGLWYDF